MCCSKSNSLMWILFHQFNSVQFSTVQFSSVQRGMIFCSVLFSSVLFCLVTVAVTVTVSVAVVHTLFAVFCFCCSLVGCTLNECLSYLYCVALSFFFLSPLHLVFLFCEQKGSVFPFLFFSLSH